MAKKKSKQTVKPKEDIQTMDGLNMSFEDAMKVLSQPQPKESSSKTGSAVTRDGQSKN